MSKPGKILATLLLMLAAGCSADRLQPELQQEYVSDSNGTTIKVSVLQKGRMCIYVSEELAARLEEDPESFIRENEWMGITSICRTFPKEEQFEERTRSRGMHLWYDVEFYEDVPLTKAGKGLGEVDGIEQYCYRPRIHHLKGQDVGWRDASTAAYASLRAAGSEDAPFDDPAFKDQWNLYNPGTAMYTVAGCDINVVPAWQNYLCGNPEVIVGVVDGGIEFKHDDLAGNMWHNPEQSGDLQYGYNFVDNTYKVSGEDHGTHVAGIIGAVNNNATGGCGIAGGDAKRGIPGVRLMSCQIFKQNSDDNGDDYRAIKWAADHGAVICQNSWSYDKEIDYMPGYAKQAIDYFIAYAGTDHNGNQTGPMKGGLVVFAAGNESTKSKVYPGAYSEVLTVSSLGADYKLASYSNYGDWVDIAAPGGDEVDIYSTITGNRYARYGGTSMAAPHVSGIAALIVANMGGEGFTCEMLKDILLCHTTDISEYNPSKNPGKGLVNTYEALASNHGSVQYAVAGFEATPDGRKIKTKITARPKDADTPAWISKAIVYYSQTPFTAPEGVASFKAEIREKVGSEPIELESDPLEYGKRYYMSVVLQDEYGHATAMSPVVAVDTPENLPPTISGPAGPVSLRSHEMLKLDYEVTDPYGDNVTVELDDRGNDAVQLIQEGSRTFIYLRGYMSQPGTFNFKITASDEFGLATELEVTYTVRENHPPVLIGQIGDIIIDDNSTYNINLGDYFYDEDGEQLSYSFANDNPKVVKTALGSDTASLIPQQYGCANLTLSATDMLGNSVECSFRLLIRDGSHTVELYPNPVTAGNLYVRTGLAGSVEVTVANAAGGVVFDGTLASDPFSPAVIDLSSCAAGVYNVTTSAWGDSETRKIVKL